MYIKKKTIGLMKKNLLRTKTGLNIGVFQLTHDVAHIRYSRTCKFLAVGQAPGSDETLIA